MQQFFSQFGTILMILPLIVIFYFLVLRPQQRRMREMQKMQSEVGPGARVMLTSGIVGTVRHVGDQQLVLELAPGVEVTVVKGAIGRTLTDEEDEFEYEEEAHSAVATPTPEPAVTPALPAQERPLLQTSEEKGK